MAGEGYTEEEDEEEEQRARQRNPFVDDMAEEDDTEEEEEEEEDDEDEGGLVSEEFVVDEVHSSEEDEEASDREGDKDDTVCARAQLRGALELESERLGEKQWEEMLGRAKERSAGGPMASGGEELFNWGDEDGLWEIRCQVGKEDVAVHTIFLNSTVARSAISHPSRPGRIYVEVYSIDDARRVARCCSFLNPHCIFAVPREEQLKVLHVNTPMVENNTWARVRDKRKAWKDYRDDVGLVVIEKNKSVVLLLPRVRFGPGPSDDTAAAPQQLFVRMGGGGRAKRFRHKRRQYTEKGLLEVALDKLEMSTGQDVLPKLTEFQEFKLCGVLDAATLMRTESALVYSRLNIHDRVKVIGGSMRGLIGTVVGHVNDEELQVHLSSLDLVESIRRADLRADFRVGDEVKVLSGPDAGLNAWVVGVRPGGLQLLHESRLTESWINCSEVQYTNSDVSFSTLRTRTDKRNGRLGGRDPNEVYVGKRVIVVGSHQYKGYLGRIKWTTPGGKAQVELDASLTRLLDCDLSALALYLGERNQRDVADNSRVAGPSGLAGGAPKAPAATEQVAPAALPVPPPEDNDRAPTWLYDVEFEGCRVKLKMYGQEDSVKSLQFVGREHGKIAVQDGKERKVFDVRCLVPVRPVQKGDMATPVVGEKRGSAFVVRSIADERATLYVKGTRRTKKNPDVEYNISDLVEVYPPLS